MKIGIIGLGFVGKAVRDSYGPDFFGIPNDHIIDPNVSSATGTYEIIKNTDAVYICVPSPQNEDGSCDTSILNQVLLNLEKVDYKGLIISKVTMPPGEYKKLNDIFDNLVYVPEFLTAANASQDYMNSRFQVIGGKNNIYTSYAEKVLSEIFRDIQYIHCSIEEASMMKYTVNCFLATKVMFMNEIKELCDKTNVDYDKVSKLINWDKRIGSSHLKVPGLDGQLGFGGACFPKDTSALLHYAKENNFDMKVLSAAVEKNKLIRKD